MMNYFRFGRRVPVCILHVLTGISLLGILIHTITAADKPSLIPLAMTLALIGKMGVSATFAIMIPYTKEMVPTNIR